MKQASNFPSLTPIRSSRSHLLQYEDRELPKFKARTSIDALYLGPSAVQKGIKTKVQRGGG